MPHDAEDYVHRIGRTARAQRDGVAITFVSEADMRYFADIERFLEKDIQKNALPEGLGEGPEYKPTAPRKSSRGRGGHNHGGKKTGDRRHHRPRKGKNKKAGDKVN